MNLDLNLDEWVRAQLVGVPEDLRKPVAVRTAQAAGIDPFAALEAVNRLDSARERARRPGKVRAPSRTRLQRAEARPDRETGRQYVPATALDPLLDPTLCSGAKTLLMLIRALAGSNRIVETLTVSLAVLMCVSRRTVQIWYRQLVAAGLLTHHYDRQRGIVILGLAEQVEPPEAARQPRPVRPPTPDMSFRTRWKRRMAALRCLGSKLPGGGANQNSHINTERDLRFWGRPLLVGT